MKKISIMLTSYNLEDYIDKSIQSVVQQEIPCDWELLIGDDGSTDKTVELVNAWIEKYPTNIKLYQWSKDDVHSMNGFRAAANRANLLERATGDYLIYLDGDDCWLGTEKLKTQFELLEKAENKDCSCCGHNIYKYEMAENKGKNMIADSLEDRRFTCKEYYNHRMYVHTNTILFRKECKELMLNPVYRGFLNDVFITFCILQFGSMLFINKSWAQYNITGSGLWTGAKKVYSCFRNIHLLDLELRICPSLKYIIFRHLSSNVRYVLEKYTLDDQPTIEPIVRDLDPEIFHYTKLLYKLKNLTFREVMEKKILMVKLNIIKVRTKIGL